MLPPHLRPVQVRELPVLILQTWQWLREARFAPQSIALVAAPAAARGIAPAYSCNSRGDCRISRGRFRRLFGDCCSSRLWASGHGPAAPRSRSIPPECWASYSRRALENVPPDPVRALEATGASRVAVAAFGNFPLAMGPIAVHTLFRFEWNVRAATVLGLSARAESAKRSMKPSSFSSIMRCSLTCSITCVIVGLFDFASTNLRKRYRVSWEAIE